MKPLHAYASGGPAVTTHKVNKTSNYAKNGATIQRITVYDNNADYLTCVQVLWSDGTTSSMGTPPSKRRKLLGNRTGESRNRQGDRPIRLVWGSPKARPWWVVARSSA